MCRKSVTTVVVLGRSFGLLNPLDFPADVSGLALKSHTQRNVLFLYFWAASWPFRHLHGSKTFERRVGLVVPLETTTTSLA